MPGVIAVHCGAGHHSEKLHGKYNKLSKQACKKGIEVLKNGGTPLEAVRAVIVVLENSPITNAGYGSNLTCEGIVEGDASVMNGETLMYGGCGAVKNIKNPINLAYDICMKQSETLPLGLVPPMLLVGKGALQHAKSNGIKLVPNKTLVTAKAFNQYKKYKRLLERATNQPPHRLDTVGAVCVDDKGHVAAGCSSGGILLKRPGRVGQAAIYGSGTWADSFNPKDEPSIAVCTTGCGEHLIQTNLAKEIAENLKTSLCPTTGLSNVMTDKFLNSKYLGNVKQKLAGALTIYVNNKTDDVMVLWGHSTESMSIGYMTTNDEKPKSTISKLPKEVSIGTTINVGGAYFYKKT